MHHLWSTIQTYHYWISPTYPRSLQTYIFHYLSQINLQSNLTSNHPTTLDDLHHKLRHIGYQTLCEITNNGSISRIDIDFSTEPKFCTACVQGKAQQKSFPKESQTEYSKYGEKVVTDLWGPAQVESLGGNWYYHLHHDMYV